ncbi:MAG: hypothetical protein JNL82_16885 [Myxococcales bacterium]|nr:hypothetical protein [Myxococcales bacterium]
MAPPSVARLTRVRGWLASPRALVVLPLLAALLALPALAGGLALDDLLLREQLTTDGRGLASAYDFIAGGPEQVAAGRASGAFPWWTADDLRVRFMRPLASALLALDLRVSGAPWWMHLHSALWSALLAAAAAGIYRATTRRGGEAPWVAGLALLLFVVDDAHAASVGWIAARHGLIAATFAAAAILAHLRWRADGWTPGAWIGPAALALGLLASESALGALAYLLAHACTLAAPGWRARLLPLAPYLVVTAAWSAAYRLLGHGAAGCGMYIDPGDDPLGFVGAALVHAPLLLTAQLGPPGIVELLPFVPGALRPAAALAWLGLVVGAWILRPLLRASAAVRFWALGMVLATLPAAGALPGDRNLLLVGLGAAGLVAATISRLHAEPRPGRPLRALAWAWLLVHGLLAALLVGPRMLAPAALHATIARAAQALPDPGETRPVLLVQAPGDVFTLYAPTLRGAAGVHVLYAGSGALTLERTDARALVLRPAGGWSAAPGDRTFRAADRPMHVGDRAALPGVVITVLAVADDGRPQAVELRGDDPLDAGALVWLAWTDGAPAPLALPAVGASRELPPPAWRFGASP